MTRFASRAQVFCNATRAGNLRPSRLSDALTMAGIDLDTGLPRNHRGLVRDDAHPVKGLLFALAALALSVALWMQSRASEAARPSRDEGAAPRVEPDATTLRP